MSHMRRAREISNNILSQAHLNSSFIRSFFVLLLVLTQPFLLQAADFNYTSNGTSITITGLIGSSGDVTIPSTIDGLPGTTIGAGAFLNNDELTGIILPNGIITIEERAFSSCSYLTEVSLPSSLVIIGDNAFRTCHDLVNITIPDGVQRIGNDAFAFCMDLPDITIPKSVIQIGIQPFKACYDMTAITVDPLNEFYCSVDGVLFDKEKTLLVQYPTGKNTQNYSIPTSVTTIEAGSFYNCDQLYGTIVIPQGVTSVREYAFYSSDNVRGVIIPSSVTHIGNHAFSRCRSLSTITVDSLNRVYSSLDEVLFNKEKTVLIHCPPTKIGSYVIPSSVTALGSYAFYYCNDLTEITIPNGVLSIGSDAFNGCRALTQITIPSSITSIGNYGFYNCNQLTEIHMQGNAPSIGSRAFNKVSAFVFYLHGTTGWDTTFGGLPTALEGTSPEPGFTHTTLNGKVTITGFIGSSGDVTIPSTINGLPVTTIGADAFLNDDELTAITLPNGILTIEEDAFYSCSYLTEISLPASLITIEDRAFRSCRNLVNITIPDGVQRIGNDAFAYCMDLSDITVPKSVTHIGIQPFKACYDMTAITVDPLNEFYCSVDGVLFNKEKTLLVQYPTGKNTQNYSIPASVTTIEAGSFYNCDQLYGTIVIPEGVTSIGEYAFYINDNLRGIIIPSSVTNIGNHAFSGCRSLSTITVDSLNRVYSSLDEVLFNKEKTILIQCAVMKTGRYTIPDSVTALGDSAFDDCERLTAITIPNGVLRIGSHTFDNCSGLTQLTVPSSVTHIEYNSFYKCTNLTKIYMKGNIPNIGTRAFHTVPATVYYLPDSSGWEATFGGLSTVLWDPTIIRDDGEFGVQASGFCFSIKGSTNLVVVVEASTNIADGIWVPVQTNNISTESILFNDSQWEDHAQRFYRFRMP